MNQLRDVRMAKPIGLVALVFSVLYLLSDVIEAIQGGFSDGQLWLTLVAEAAIPIFVIGLYLVQRPQMGRLGEVSALAYAYSFVFFTATVVYALVNGTSDFDALNDDLGAALTIHGAIMLLAGLGFGYAVIKAGVLPGWTGVALMAGVVLVSLPGPAAGSTATGRRDPRSRVRWHGCCADQPELRPAGPPRVVGLNA
jgi:hypothetical protein